MLHCQSTSRGQLRWVATLLSTDRAVAKQTATSGWAGGCLLSGIKRNSPQYQANARGNYRKPSQEQIDSRDTCSAGTEESSALQEWACIPVCTCVQICGVGGSVQRDTSFPPNGLQVPLSNTKVSKNSAFLADGLLPPLRRQYIKMKQFPASD